LRMSNKLIRGDSQQQLQMVPHGGGSGDAMNQMMNMMMMQQQMWMRMAGQTQAQSESMELPGFQIFKPKCKEEPPAVTNGALVVPSVPEKDNQVQHQKAAQAAEADLKTPPPRPQCLRGDTTSFARQHGRHYVSL